MSTTIVLLEGFGIKQPKKVDISLNNKANYIGAIIDWLTGCNDSLKSIVVKESRSW